MMGRMGGNVCGVVKYIHQGMHQVHFSMCENKEERYCYVQGDHSGEVSGKILGIV
jgi:hypothetical protein